MSAQIGIFAIGAALMMSVAGMAAHAQTSAADKSSNMGLPGGSATGASNGAGTSGSLTHDDGKASSTVAGVQGGTTGFTSADKSTATHPPGESDPAIGARKSPQ